MTLPRPADHHRSTHPVEFSDGLTVYFTLRLIVPSVEEEIMAAGDKRALERHGDADGEPVTTVDDIAPDLLTAGIESFHTSADPTVRPWDHELSAELWTGPDAWPPAIKRGLFDAVQRFAVTGRVVDPKASSEPNENAS